MTQVKILKNLLHRGVLFLEGEIAMLEGADIDGLEARGVVTADVTQNPDALTDKEEVVNTPAEEIKEENELPENPVQLNEQTEPSSDAPTEEVKEENTTEEKPATESTEDTTTEPSSDAPTE